MAELRTRPLYSYRDDPAVPTIDDRGPIAVMDGECVLCTAGARAIARFDRERAFRIGRTQSALGAALVRHYGLEPADPETWLYLEDGSAWSGMEAIIPSGHASVARDGCSESCASFPAPPGSGSTGASRATATGSAAPTSARCPTPGCAPG